MLVLSRREGQSLLIGDNIEVMVVDIRPEQVKLGIAAPKDVGIKRKEVVQLLEQQRRELVGVKE